VSFNITPAPSPTNDEVIALIRSEDVFANYTTQDVDDVGSIIYIGQVKVTGEWLVTLVTETLLDLNLVYANVSNNPGKTSFSLAWTNRATLNYTLISSLTGV
jgi:hypothetical protein